MNFEKLLEEIDRRVPETMDRLFTTRGYGDFDQLTNAVATRGARQEKQRDVWNTFAGSIQARLRREDER